MQGAAAKEANRQPSADFCYHGLRVIHSTMENEYMRPQWRLGPKVTEFQQ